MKRKHKVALTATNNTAHDAIISDQPIENPMSNSNESENSTENETDR